MFFAPFHISRSSSSSFSILSSHLASQWSKRQLLEHQCVSAWGIIPFFSSSPLHMFAIIGVKASENNWFQPVALWHKRAAQGCTLIIVLYNFYSSHSPLRVYLCRLCFRLWVDDPERGFARNLGDLMYCLMIFLSPRIIINGGGEDKLVGNKFPKLMHRILQQC